MSHGPGVKHAACTGCASGFGAGLVVVVVVVCMRLYRKEGEALRESGNFRGHLARVSAAVAAAGEEADEVFHTDQDWKTVKLTVWPVVSPPRVSPMNAEYSASELSDA